MASRVGVSLALTPDLSVNPRPEPPAKSQCRVNTRRDQPLRSRCARSATARRMGPEDVAPGDRCGQRCSVVARIHAGSEREPRPEPRVESQDRVNFKARSAVAVSVCTFCHCEWGRGSVAPGDRCGQRCSVVARVHARTEREPRPEPRVESRYRVASSPGSGIAVPACTLGADSGRSLWAASARAPAPTPSGGRTAVSRQPSPEAERACRAQRRACRALADGGCRCRSGTRSRTD